MLVCWPQLDGQKALDARMLGYVNDYAAAQVALGFGRFFTHQVAHAGAVALDFTATSHRETFLGAGMGLHLRHKKIKTLKPVWMKRQMGSKPLFSKGAQRYARFWNQQIKKQKFAPKKKNTCTFAASNPTPKYHLVLKTFNIEIMGRGDFRSRSGKIRRGSHGKSRPKNRHKLKTVKKIQGMAGN